MEMDKKNIPYERMKEHGANMRPGSGILEIFSKHYTGIGNIRFVLNKWDFDLRARFTRMEDVYDIFYTKV